MTLIWILVMHRKKPLPPPTTNEILGTKQFFFRIERKNPSVQSASGIFFRSMTVNIHQYTYGMEIFNNSH